MDILYIYSFKKSEKHVINIVKRRFYYNLKQKSNYITQKIFDKEQIFLVNEKNEQIIDSFLNEYLDWISYYKFKVTESYLIQNKFNH